GDRVGIVDEKGRYIPSDHYMIAIIRSLVPASDNKKILYDVKCSKALSDEITRLGGTAVISRTGNSYTKAATRENNCIFGGEYSGHVYFRDKFLGFDSGIYGGLRMLEILSHTELTMSQLLEGIPVYYSTPELKIASTDTKKIEVVEKIKEYCLEQDYSVVDIDGVRIEFDDGWALVRYSNTGPNITARFEGKTEQVRDRLQDEFLSLIDQYNL
ncbi:MAG: phosphomannomutase, partial [bacterium]|nr:phosphomannomutase [bacterium]